MKLDTRNFGVIDIDEEKVIYFPEGIPGFEEERKFVIINNEDEENPFNWLQSITNPDLAFVIIDPFFIFPEYVVDLPETVQNKLKIKDEKDVAVYSIVVVPEDLRKMTTNLLGPIIVNIRERLGKQVILDDPRYTTKHYIFAQEDRGE
ncbi:MAG: flagellar assembly protein FliW [Tissierellia bacterium]|nr:flagellar assembly protein FliW [Tissierellia bacterium]